MFELGLTLLPAQLAGILVLGVAVAYWLGYGATRWLLPEAWLPYRWLLMPAVGLTLFAVIAQPLALFGVNSPMLIVILFSLALVANVSAFLKAPRAQAGLAPREIIFPLGIALGVIVLGVLPFFAYGYLTVMGYNVDGSTYVAQAEFAKRFGLARAQLMTIPSVYAESVVHVITVGVGAVGPLWHSVLSQLMGRDAFYSYTPVLILWYAFSFFSVFVLYRITFRLKPGASLLALAALALNTMLWTIPLDNFALHTFALALLPVEWMATLHYLETRERRALILAALTLGAQILTYPEATPFYLLPFLFYLGLVALRERGIPWRAIRAWGQIGVLSLVLAPTAYWTLYAGAVHQSQTLSRAVGGTVDTFISLAEGIGFSPLSLVEHEGMVAWEYVLRDTWNSAVWVMFAILLLCAVVGFLQSYKSERVFLTATGSALVVTLAWMFFVQDYPYGFFKTWVTSLFVWMAFLALGVETAVAALRASERTRRFSYAALVIAVLWIAFEVVSMLGFEKKLAERPPVVTRKLIQLANSKLIPPGASVYLSLTNTPNPRMYWAAYFLREHPLYGSGLVAYSAIQNAQDGVIYDYALLNRGENPIEFDYAPDAVVWDDRWTVLYKRP